MEKDNLFWTPIEKKLLNLIKENKNLRKKWFKSLYKELQRNTLITLHSTTGVQQAIYVKWAQKNPNYGDTILAYSRTFHQNVSYDIAKMAIADQICFLEKLYKKYHKVIIKKYEAKIKDKPSDSDYITAHLWEALARGYKVKLKKTIPKDTLHLYSLSKIHKITLFYPKIFNNETDAKEFTKTHSIHI